MSCHVLTCLDFKVLLLTALMMNIIGLLFAADMLFVRFWLDKRKELHYARIF